MYSKAFLFFSNNTSDLIKYTTFLTRPISQIQTLPKSIIKMMRRVERLLREKRLKGLVQLRKTKTEKGHGSYLEINIKQVNSPGSEVLFNRKDVGIRINKL